MKVLASVFHLTRETIFQTTSLNLFVPVKGRRRGSLNAADKDTHKRKYGTTTPYWLSHGAIVNVSATNLTVFPAGESRVRCYKLQSKLKKKELEAVVGS